MNLSKKTLRSLYTPFSKYIHERWALLFPKSYARYVFKKNYNKKLNLKDPKDFNEKIQWLKIYSDTSQWTTLADKYKVREYVSQCGLGDHLVKLYGVWKRADDIEFSELPDKFVLKTNHGYEHTLMVDDKSKLDIDETRKRLNQWVRERYGLVSFEPHYWYIDRRIIAEELLEDVYNARISQTLIDYKFYCLNGEPHIIKALYDRKIMMVGGQARRLGAPRKAFAFDLDWNLRPDAYLKQQDRPAAEPVPRPGQLEEMLRICRILSKPFPQVRVDLYEVHHKVYFGELTFTPGGGKDLINPDYFMEMGEILDLSAINPRHKRVS